MTKSSSLTLSSAVTRSARASIAARSASLATITARRSGWRTFAFAWARAARPSSTVRRTASIPSSSSGSRERRVDLREVAQVDRVRQPPSARAAGEVAVDLVGEEGGERRQHRRRLQQAVAQGREGGAVAVPEAAAARAARTSWRAPRRTRRSPARRRCSRSRPSARARSRSSPAAARAPSGRGRSTARAAVAKSSGPRFSAFA